MTTQGIFLRAHTVTASRSERKNRRRKLSTWPEQVLVFDTETTTDTEQDLLFGVYRLCELKGDEYYCSEEGMFYADDLDADQLEALKNYARSEIAGSEINAFPPKLKLALYSRSIFLKKVFWKTKSQLIQISAGQEFPRRRSLGMGTMELEIEDLNANGASTGGECAPCSPPDTPRQFRTPRPAYPPISPS